MATAWRPCAVGVVPVDLAADRFDATPFPVRSTRHPVANLGTVVRCAESADSTERGPDLCRHRAAVAICDQCRLDEAVAASVSAVISSSALNIRGIYRIFLA